MFHLSTFLKFKIYRLVFFYIFVVMKTKSEKTTEYIIQKVAPIFNKKGYKATSLKDLIEVTGLTKGAIYGNFECKEDIALKAFQFNTHRVLSTLKKELSQKENAIDKLFMLTNFHRTYYDFVLDYGGCPILNVAIDSKNVNSKLYEASCDVSRKLENSLAHLIQTGIDKKEINPVIDAKITAKNMYSMIEGSIFMSVTHQDKNYIDQMMNHIDSMIYEKLKQ
jgi:TetR/AcrR family transcriptional regulator, transcriptional repressor for nem operon